MDLLNTFISLLARTQGRDKALRLVQFACLRLLDQKSKGSSAQKIYYQMRMTRKLLRFLRSLEYSSKIKEDVPKLMNNFLHIPSLLKYVTAILQNLFTVLYFLSDHRVCLGQLGVIDRSHAVTNLPRSMKFYFLQNLFGILHDLVMIMRQVKKGKNKQDKIINSLLFDLVKCFLDCFVALFYWKGLYTTKRIGTVGVITSLMAIAQSLGYI